MTTCLVKTDLEFQRNARSREDSRQNPVPEFWSLVECPVWSSGVRWNSGLLEPRILESGAMPVLESWSPVEFWVTGTQNPGVQWNASSGVLEPGEIPGLEFLIPV